MVSQVDQDKIAFTTPWGTFMYARMPFGLTHAGATFQRAMDLAFVGKTSEFTFIFLNDLTIFSDSDENHLKHLRRVFERCVIDIFGHINPKLICQCIRANKPLKELFHTLKQHSHLNTSFPKSSI